VEENITGIISKENNNKHSLIIDTYGIVHVTGYFGNTF
jgi:hypothetical protein